MRVFRLLLIAALTCAALLAIAPAAGAASKSSGCAAFATLQSDFADTQNIKSASDLGAAWEKVGNAYRKAAKQAPKELKSALNSLGDAYKSVDSPGDLSNLNAAKYSKALTKFVKYVSTNC